MPELPEVETVLRGVAPHIEGRTVAAVTVRQAKLRQPVPETLGATLAGETVLECSRRAKYRCTAPQAAKARPSGHRL